MLSVQVARYLPNPEKNWGPKPKHGRVLKVAPALLSSIKLVSGCDHRY